LSKSTRSFDRLTDPSAPPPQDGLVTDNEAKQPKPAPGPAVQDDDPDAIYAPESMALKSSDIHLAGATTEIKLPNRITVDKPSKQAYFRHHPDFYLKTFLIKHEATRAWYYPATPEVRDLLSEFVRVVELYGYVTLLGDFRFWPITVTEAENDWNESAREIIQQSVEEWVGFRSLEGRYEVRHPNGDHPEPKWPKAAMKELLARAFRGTRTVKDMSHRVAKSLLGAD